MDLSIKYFNGCGTSSKVHTLDLALCNYTIFLCPSEWIIGRFLQKRERFETGCALVPYFFVISMNVLSKSLDKFAAEHKIGYHPKFKNLSLTHLSFADGIRVFLDGNFRSIQSIIEIFDKFAHISGLLMSVEKSTIYYGVVGGRVCIDMGISLTATVESAMTRRSRQHRYDLYAMIEEALNKQRSKMSAEEIQEERGPFYVSRSHKSAGTLMFGFLSQHQSTVSWFG
ncbi:hypothetical protein Bca4012_083723 [Brassica carinata]